MVEEELVEFTILGRKIGKARGWDEVDDLVIYLYDFVANTGYKGPVGSGICINYSKGTITVPDSDGKDTKSMDIFEALADMPRVEKDE
jgi:hypothetical protein